MHVELPNGYKAEVFVQHHDTPEAPEARWSRTTTVEVNLGEQVFRGRSKCSKSDQFRRRTGKKIAAERVLADLRAAGISEETRRAIFRSVCPEFFKPKKKDAPAPEAVVSEAPAPVT